MRLAILLVLAAAPAEAQPRTLEMQYLVGENLHIANQGGSINRHDTTTLKLELRTGGKLAGTETGKAREFNSYPNPSWNSEDLQSWTHRWSGTWKQTGAALRLDVVLDDRKCTHTKTRTGAAPEQLACGTVTKQIRFDCTTEQVELLTPAKTKRDVWRCQPAGTVELDRTPLPWTFGKTGCVKMLGGRSGLAYEAC